MLHSEQPSYLLHHATYVLTWICSQLTMSQIFKVYYCTDISIFVVTRKHCKINIFLTACPPTKKCTGMCMPTSHFVNSHFVNSQLVNVDKVGIDKVGIDKVEIDKVEIDKVGIDEVGS